MFKLIQHPCPAALAAAALLAAGPAGAQTAVPPTLSKIGASNTIVLGYRDTSAPFSYVDGGKPVGFSIDLCYRIVDAVKAKLKKPDLKVQMEMVTANSRIPSMVGGTIDLECGSSTNNTQRHELVDFTVNTFYTGTRLLVKKSSGIKSWEDIKGKRATSTSGTTNLVVLRKYSIDHHLDIQAMVGKTDNEAVAQVDSGKADAFAMDDILLYGFAANSKNPAEWAVVGEPLQVEPYAIMLRKDDPQFKKLADEALIEVMRSGEFEKLYKKWFLSPTPPNNVNYNVPMSDALKQNLKAPNDKPAT
jgi:glutamate/aspartate transport system substrate-binding protein